MYHRFHHNAEDLIRHNGGKVTAGRVGVLAILLAEQQAMTHREIEQRLPPALQLDRVTLYRVLEWLTGKKLIHKVSSDDRVWRYHVNRDVQSHQHAHFKCTGCAQVICLETLPMKHNWRLPAGYQLQEVELTVKGLCASCC